MAGGVRTGTHARPAGLDLIEGAVKRARSEAGLSLGGLAGGDISRTALHLIETGKSRPTLTTLSLIARRTGKPLDYFLQPGQEAVLKEIAAARVAFALDQVEATILHGDLEAAASALDALPLEDTPRPEQPRHRLLQAKLLVHLGRPLEGEPAARAAVAAAESMGDTVRAAEALDLLAAAQQGLEDPASVETARRALEVCRRLDPVPAPLEARILARLGAIYDARHQWREAALHYEQSLARSDEVTDLQRVARSHNGLALAYLGMGDLEGARAHAQRAVAIHEVLRDRLSIASAENNLGLVLVEQGKPKEARPHLERSLAICEEAGIRQGRAHVLISLAEAALAEDDLAGAAARAEEAAALASELGERDSVATAHEVLGDVAARQRDRNGTDRHFAEALALLTDMEMGDRLMECHARYAALLERRGDPAAAGEHWRRALAAGHPRLVASPRMRRIAIA